MNWNLSKLFLIVVMSLMAAGVLGTLIYLSTGELTTRETGLLSTILTILSLVVAWIMSHLYSSSSHKQAIEEVKGAHQENLQTYALKASEKVNNLSDQLNKLSIYLEEELESTDYDTVEETLRAREERLHSAIHMIGMLKSVNDTALSDWQGVIGDQLEEQREERQEREEDLRELVERMEGLWTSMSSTGGDRHLANQLNALQKEMRILMAGVSGVSVKIPKPRKNVRRDIDKNCPSCNNALSYRQRAKANSHKAIDCPSCNVKLISRYSKDDDDFVLEERCDKNETLSCPECGGNVSIKLNNYPSTSRTTKCQDCNSTVRAIRLHDGGIKVTSHPTASIKLTEGILNQVKDLLPEQPWPKDIHKEIAVKLGCSNQLISKATKELIRRGIYKEQIDGRLYELVEVET